MPRGVYPRIAPAERFWARVVKTETCWLRRTADRTEQYSLLSVNARSVRANRYAWEMATGETLTDDDIIGHVCDNPSCVRNDDEGWYDIDGVLLPRRGHLFRGTTALNNRDAALKGRTARGNHNGAVLHPERVSAGRRRHAALHPESVARGEAHSEAKLTDEAVRDIRRRAGQVRQVDLAREHGVTQSLVSLVILRKAWRHLD